MYQSVGVNAYLFENLCLVLDGSVLPHCLARNASDLVPAMDFAFVLCFNCMGILSMRIT